MPNTIFSALKQVKDFLPKMKEAQEKLSSSVYNIEDVKEDESFINMVWRLWGGGGGVE